MCVCLFVCNYYLQAKRRPIYPSQPHPHPHKLHNNRCYLLCLLARLLRNVKEDTVKSLKLVKGIDPHKVKRNEWKHDIDLWPGTTYVHMRMHIILTLKKTDNRIKREISNLTEEEQKEIFE